MRLPQVPDISIDYAIMEKTANAAVVVSPITWSDLSAGTRSGNSASRDADGDVISGNATLTNTRNSLVMSRHGGHLAVQGMDNVAVIASEDAVYVGRLEDSQHVGKLVKMLAGSSRPPSSQDLQALPPLGWLYLGAERRPVPGQAAVSLARQKTVAAEAPSPLGTLDLRQGDGPRIGRSATPCRRCRENQSVYIPRVTCTGFPTPAKSCWR